MQSDVNLKEQTMVRVIYEKADKIPVTVYGTILLRNAVDFILYDTDRKNTLRINNAELKAISPVH